MSAGVSFPPYMDVAAIKDFLTTPAGIYIALFPLRLIGYGFLERRFTAHRFNQRAVITLDLVTTFFLVIVTLPIAHKIIGYVGINLSVPAWLASQPLGFRLAMYLVLADFLHYWVHRLMHHRLLWRVHRWHHYPAHMSWAAGNRESIPDAVMVNSAYFFCWPLVGASPGWVGAGLLVFSILKNDWMHLNVRWRLSWLEWVFVTPRYHHIHHSAALAHRDANFGIILSVWDRLFGTYRSPEVQTDTLEFGIGERPPLPRLLTGL